MKYKIFTILALLIFLLQASPFLFAQGNALARADSLEVQADTLMQQGRFEQALPLAQEAYRLREQTFGPDDRRLVSSLTTLQQLYRSLGDEATTKMLEHRRGTILQHDLQDKVAGRKTGRRKSKDEAAPAPSRGEIATPMPTLPAAPVTEEARTSTSADLVDEIIESLKKAKIVYNTPAMMRLGNIKTIELILSPVLTYDDLIAELEETGEVDSGEIRISNRMEANLSGQGFIIEALQPDLQAVGSIQPTKWRWNVTPNKPGTYSLHLTLSAHIPVAERDAPFVIQTFDRQIQVNITLPQRISAFLGTNWQWLWAAILVPFGGYIWRRVRTKAKE